MFVNSSGPLHLGKQRRGPQGQSPLPSNVGVKWKIELKRGFGVVLAVRVYHHDHLNFTCSCQALEKHDQTEWIITPGPNPRTQAETTTSDCPHLLSWTCLKTVLGAKPMVSEPDTSCGTAAFCSFVVYSNRRKLRILRVVSDRAW